jgi:aminopeptidase
LRATGVTKALIDPLYSAHSAAVGASLALFKYDLKTGKVRFFSLLVSCSLADFVINRQDAKEKKDPVEIALLGQEKAEPELESDRASGGRIKLDWETGLVYASAQNLAREVSRQVDLSSPVANPLSLPFFFQLMETAANLMTPTIFAERAVAEFSGIPNTTVEVHDQKWAEEKKMGSFLSVAKGSDEPLKFVEIRYTGGKEGDKPLVFVGKGNLNIPRPCFFPQEPRLLTQRTHGKGICFDSGGISIKPAAGMDLMRGDMGGGATVLATALAIAKLQIPVNYVAWYACIISSLHRTRY